ncbi:MAG: hypothetical protein JAY74_18930 [Candidatus Thiodiazotropha taylori]|nr:hypothetical protein [Candidatus Thiodiazotropha taylori]
MGKSSLFALILGQLHADEGEFSSLMPGWCCISPSRQGFVTRFVTITCAITDSSGQCRWDWPSAIPVAGQRGC